VKPPRRFQLGGRAWRVLTVGRKDMPPDMLGICDFESARILLRADMPDQLAEEVFWHEATHAILYIMGDDHANEAKVCALGALLHQLHATRRG